ncbi:MAG: DegV family protein [Anaerolineales bacterium]|jgi:DegV family protein with EDD domain
MIKLVADSTCNLPDHLVEKFDIKIAPIAIQFGEETFEEGIDIDRDLFYRKIEELGIIPTSSQPSPAWFERYYREYHQQGHEILVITVTQKHSGTYDSATLAKSMVPEATVEVFDSGSISLGTGWMVLEAARAAEQGVDLETIVKRLEYIRANSYLYLTPETLKYLQMSGRVGQLQGAIASLLNVKPIIYLEDGALEAGENVRKRSKAVERLIDLLSENIDQDAPIHLAVIHARVAQEAAGLLERAKSTFNVKEYLMEDLISSLAVHGGPGVLGIFAYEVE